MGGFQLLGFRLVKAINLTSISFFGLSGSLK
jgi:hypothetical protein